LANIVNDIGPETPVAIIREATKIHEEVLRGTAIELMEQTAERKWKGECVIGISPQAGQV
jgi:16S rRNA (cytidine1402-2'-O)-methyltransferase